MAKSWNNYSRPELTMAIDLASMTVDQVRGCLRPMFRIDALSRQTWKSAFQHCSHYPSDFPGLLERRRHWLRNRQDLKRLWEVFGWQRDSHVRKVFREDFTGVLPGSLSLPVYFDEVLRYLGVDDDLDPDMLNQMRISQIGWATVMRARRAVVFMQDSGCDSAEASRLFGLNKSLHVQDAEQQMQRERDPSRPTPRCFQAYNLIMTHGDLSLRLFLSP